MRKSRKAAVRQEDNSLLRESAIILKGAVFAVIITLTCIIIFAFVMKLATLQESVIKPVVQVVRIISIAAGGAYAARLGDAKGWLKGAGAGIFYVVIVSIAGLIGGGGLSLDRILISDTVMAVIVGAVGGAIGINIR